MSLISRSTLHFLGVFVGMCVVMAGVGGFLALHDEDWQYSYDRAEDQYPRNEGNTNFYDQLPPEQRTTVDRAMAGETITFETEEGVPPAVVKRNGTYHVFNRHTVFDFLDPGTGLSALVALSGGGLVVLSARADVKH